LKDFPRLASRREKGRMGTLFWKEKIMGSKGKD